MGDKGKDSDESFLDLWKSFFRLWSAKGFGCFVLVVVGLLAFIGVALPSYVMGLAAYYNNEAYYNNDEMTGFLEWHEIPPWVEEPGIDGEITDFRWMDNRRLLVARGESEKSQEYWGSPSDFVVWEEGKGARIAAKPENPKHRLESSLCYDSGNVSYEVRLLDPPEGLTFRQRHPQFSGPLGAAKRFEPEYEPDRPAGFNTFICLNSPIPETAIGRGVIPLRPGDGVISRVFCEDGNVECGYFWHADDGTGRVVNLMDEKLGGGEFASIEFLQSAIKFAPFENAYFMPSKEMDGDCQQAWWIRPGPKVDKFCVFKRGSPQEYAPTKAGVLWAGIVRTYNPRTREDGLYLSRENRFVRITNGYVGAFDVSPDGCRVAFTLSWWKRVFAFSTKRIPKTLKIVDLCANLADFPEVELAGN